MAAGINLDLCLRMLREWAAAAERYWHPLRGRPQLGCFGTGYNNWGVQTNQKYVAAMAVLAAHGDERALDRALAALRFSLASHLTGEGACTDGTKWGHTWISALGIERMMHGVRRLTPHLDADDLAALRRVLLSEAEWLSHRHERGGHKGIHADCWASSGRNHPESNLWNGALLWRVAAMYPDEPSAAAWREASRRFLVNGVSVPEDAGRPGVVGANFFSRYALDHHGYMNVGYMAICASQAAMAHFDLRALGLEVPEELHQHQREMWQVLRRMVFEDGRLARIGGDSRIRYAYCQEYLLPALLYAADQLGDAHALELAGRQVEMMAREQAFNADGSFYGKRLEILAESNPYYYTRLESDRACALSMALEYAPMVRRSSQGGDLEAHAAGGWCEPEHGDVLHRGPQRLASFAWRAYGTAQGLCLPPDDGHLAEWWQNLSGCVRFPGDPWPPKPNRRLLKACVTPIEGGFLACGAFAEGAKLAFAEGWQGTDLLLRHLAIVALPDGQTVIGIERLVTGRARAYLAECQGLHLNLPNDLYNGFRRSLSTEQGSVTLTAPAAREEAQALGSRWANIEGRIGVVGLYGADTLSVVRRTQRVAGPYPSLYAEELAWPARLGVVAVDPDTVLLDVAWAVLSDVDAASTHEWAAANAAARVQSEAPLTRQLQVRGMDNRAYHIIADFAADTVTLNVPGRALATTRAREVRQ